MPIDRWEMVPSSHPNRYIIRLACDRADAEAIVQLFPQLCSGPREMSDPAYKWGILVDGASLNDRLAIQDKLREYVPEQEAPFTAAEMDLSGVLAELSMVLDELTGLTDEERAHVEKKMQMIKQREAEQVLAAAKVATLRPKPPAKKDGGTTAPSPAAPPKSAAPASPAKPAAPSAPKPPAAAPTKPPAAPPAAQPPASPQSPLSVEDALAGFIQSLPAAAAKAAAPPPAPPATPAKPPTPAPPAPAKPPTATPAAPQSPAPPPATAKPPTPTAPPVKTPAAPLTPPTPVSPSAPPAAEPPKTEEFKIVRDVAPLKPAAPPAAPPATPAKPPTPAPAQPSVPPAAVPAAGTPPAAPAVPPAPAAPPAAAAPAVPPAPAAPPPVAAPVSVPIPPTETAKPPEDNELQIACFFPPEEETLKNQFLRQLVDTAQKKAKKPLILKPVVTQACAISNQTCAEWIRSSKEAGAACFFVLLSRDLLPDYLENSVQEARAAGLHCFLIPAAEVASGLLYVELMVELMLVRKRK